MQPNETFKLEGMAEVIKALEELPVALQDKIIKGFLQKAGREYIVKNLKSALPYHARSEQGIRVVSDPKNKNAVFAGPTSNIYWYRWADKGTKERTKGHYRGAIAPKNVIRSVIDSQIQPIIKFANEEFGNEVNKSLERRIRTIRKRNS